MSGSAAQGGPRAGDAEAAEVTLPAEPGSASRARRHVRHVLAGPPRELPGDVVGNAELCVSELVTNALLHAGTPVTVRVAVHDDPSEPVVRVAVADGSAVPPQWVPRSLTAGTGRGLPLITALSTARGVDVHEDGSGKEVWCELSAQPQRAAAAGDAPADAPGGEDALLVGLAAEWASVVAELADDGPAQVSPAQVSPAQAPPAQAPPAQAPPAGDGPPVRLLGYPLRTGVRMREHREALLRELRLMGLGHRISDPRAAAVASDVAEMLGATYGGVLSDVEVQKVRALRAGHEHTDLEYPRFPGQEAAIARWRDLLADLDRLRVEAGLDTLEPPPDVVALWAWVLEEFSGQVEGRPPRPWPGGT
ncbi:ATP-binding protein [Kineococcus glutinatus]|uniref:ATP-binding protein n=1 Tax=Kineococcus glutinatus TaxID=1070872 RepID=UPI0031E4ECC1